MTLRVKKYPKVDDKEGLTESVFMALACFLESKTTF